MAITNRWKVGRTRRKLAQLLEQALGITVCPEDIESNHPYYASVQFGGCTWTGYGTLKRDRDTYFYSWTTMTECVRYGIETEPDADMYQRFEVFSKK